MNKYNIYLFCSVLEYIFVDTIRSLFLLGHNVQPGGGTTIEMREPISAVFALRYMNSFTRATPLENRVTFYLSSELPMVIEYQMAEMEYVRYYIAPAMGQYGAEASPLRGQDEEGSYQDSSEDDEAELPMVVDEGSPLRDQDDDRSSQDSSESAW